MWWNATRRSAINRRTNRSEVFKYSAVSVTVRYFSTALLPSSGLIVSCRTVAGWYTARGELRGGVLGLLPLSFRDGTQQQHRAGWHVGI
jgi:hypothetical protein